MMGFVSGPYQKQGVNYNLDMPGGDRKYISNLLFLDKKKQKSRLMIKKQKNYGAHIHR